MDLIRLDKRQFDCLTEKAQDWVGWQKC